MTNYLIIEDEHLAYEELERMMRLLRPDYKLIKWARSTEQAIHLLQQFSPDLVMADIRLADGLCFEIFTQVASDVPVIFTTAYDEYAIRAFKLNGIDYLLKPIEDAELEAALCKFERHQALRASIPLFRKLEQECIGCYSKKRFLIQVGDTYLHVETEDIAFFYSEDKYTYLYRFSGKRYIISYSLDQLEKILDGGLFFRISRCCIVNIRSIVKTSKYFASRLKLQLRPECPHELLVSRGRVSDFLHWMDDKLF